MQIDRRASRGPYVAALICLLVLSLTIPIYWRSGIDRDRQLNARNRTWADWDGLAWTGADGFRPLSGRSGYRTYPPDPLDELLAELARQSGRHSSSEPDLFLELLAEPDASVPRGVVSQYVWRALRRAGRMSTESSPGDGIAHLLTRLAGSRQPQRRRSDALPTFSLLLKSPNDRIALAPAREPQLIAAGVDAFPSPWCVPVALLERLELLAQHPYSAVWARQTIDEVRRLTENNRPRTAAVAATLERLRSLAAQAMQLAADTSDDRLRAELLRAHWGLTRRLECWPLMRDIVVASIAENRFATRVPVDGTGTVPFGQGSETAELHALSSELEAYEQSRSPRLARAIVERQCRLAQSNDPRRRALAGQIEENYRNANVRLALSAEMLERFMSQEHPEVSPVHDWIAGTPVRGQSITSAENLVKLQPDAQRWNLGIAADGTVHSNTVAEAGQVKVRSRGTTAFTAQKSIVVEHDGVRMGPSTAAAQTHSHLVGVQSSFDWIPVIGDMIRQRAIDEYRKKQAWARAEVECKVARRVEEQLDERAVQVVDKMQHQLRDQLSAPLEAAGVELTPIELSTTGARLIARLRVAAEDQLAGHTPRPRAPSDSLASLQLHESALTNAALSLGLNGKRLTAPELQQLLREKFSREDRPAGTIVDEDTIFEFAPEDAVRFRVADEKLEMILAMREVDHEGDSVRNFRVHAFYVPVISGLEVEFVREGPLGIEGRIRTGERARMHGVFNKVLTEDRRLPLVRLPDPSDGRLAGLMITQMVLEDGWIGMAVGPTYVNRAAERSRTLR